MFIVDQYWSEFDEAFVIAALQECMRILAHDFFLLDDYTDFHDQMRAYLNK